MTPTRLDVLVIDDNPAIGRALVRELREHCDVRVAHSLEAAWAEIDRRVPHAVICDYDLGSDSGLELLEHLVERHPGVRRVLFSGGESTAISQAVAAGVAQALLDKPWSTDDLLRALRGR
jgi:DNA-binding NtrC family response regulator